jgi:amino acid adenylation domain-containing protein/non-ribosomal peptide synthase protein (TIGR01720 family)
MTADTSSLTSATGGDVTALREELLRRRLAGGRAVRRDGITAADRTAPLPLSFGQQRLWLHSRLEPDSTEYQVPVVLRITGGLDAEALCRAWRALVDRHEVLRTRYVMPDAEPVQVVDRTALRDLELCRAATMGDAVAMADADAADPIDLATEHPVRGRLVRLGPAEHVLCLVLHHIACDGWSMEVLTRDLLGLYLGAEPAPLPVQYADFAAWQRDRLSGTGLYRELGYWQNQLAGITPLRLPTDRPRPAVRSWAGDRVLFEVPSSTADALRRLAAEHDATLFTVALTAYQVLLARWCGTRDVAVGSAVAGRSRPEVQDLIGFFLNTVVLRLRWSEDPLFGEVLRRNRRTVLDAFDHQDAPVQLLVDDLDAERDLSRTPLFQVMFDLVKAPPPSVELPGITVSAVDVVGAVAKHDLRLELAEQADGSLRGVLEYPTALFDATTVERMAGHYVRLLEQITPDIPLSELDPVGERERAMLRRWSVGATTDDEPVDVSAAVRRHAAGTPSAPAVVAEDGTLSFAELDERADRMARHLAGLGVGAESVVAVCLGRGVDLLPTLLGVWRAGAAYLPLDPGDPAERLAYVVRDCGAAVLVTSEEHVDLLDGGPQALTVLVDEEADEIAAQPAGPLGRVPDQDGLAYLIYTSGSTGRPKGVMVTHGALAGYLRWAVDTYLVPGGNGAALCTSVAFDMVVTTLYAPLVGGQPVHLLPAGLPVTGLGAALLARGGGFSFLKVTPGHLELLTDQLDEVRASTLAGTVVVGGEAFGTALLRSWRELAPATTVLLNEYGPTENTVANVTYAHRPGEPAPATEALPIGRPVPHTSAHVLDDELCRVPIGVVGELYLGGRQLARGYRRLPDRTAERFVPDPHGAPGGRLYRTGDLARLRADGLIEFLGRADGQVKVRGYRVEVGEVVAALRAHRDVRDAVVTLRGSALVAYVVCDEVEPQALAASLGRTLPAYMVPAAFVRLDRIPLTPNGKTDLVALPEPGRETRQVDGAEVAPRTPAEERVAAAWRRVLTLPVVGVHDNFFDLGGDSLSAVALVGALRDEGVDLTVQEVFARPTVAELAELAGGRPELVRRQQVRPFAMITDTDRAALPDGVTDAYPLSQIQAGMVFEMFGGGDVHYYHNATNYPMRDEEPFDADALRAAATEVVARHEVLRTSIDMTSYSQPLQLVHAHATMPVGVQDLRGRSVKEQQAAVAEVMAAERTRLFDLSTPSLLRLHAHVLDERAWSLTITECHPILEGWSYHVLLMEIVRCYRELRDTGAAAPVEQPAVRYADHIAAERAALASEETRDYWRDTLAGHPAVRLPAGWGDATSTEGPYKLWVPFDDIRDRLLELAKVAEVPLKSVVHAAHLKVLSQLTGEASFSSGLVCDARPEELGAERVLGMYLNTVPFAFAPTATTWRELVKEVFAREIELWPHRRYPLPTLQREHGGGRRLLEVMLVYLDFRTVDRELVDFDTAVDDSPNEFPLVVTISRLGLVDLMIHPSAMSRENGQRLAAMYHEVLRAMADDVDGDARATYLPPGERRLLLQTRNATDAAYPAATLSELFAAQARRTPHAVAVGSEVGMLTYAELDAAANRLAHALREAGAGPERFVAVGVPRSIELVTTLLAVHKAGAAYLPVDPDTPAARVATVLDEAAPALLVTTAGHVAAHTSGVPVLRLDDDEVRAGLRLRPPTAPDVVVRPQNPAYAIYTSGSTGRPKGVVVTHAGIVNRLSGMQSTHALTTEDRVLHKTPVGFDVSVWELFWPLVTGATLVLARPDGHRDPAYLAELVRQAEVTTAHFVPSMLQAFVREPAAAACATLRRVLCSGEALPDELADRFMALLPGTELHNLYGPTEASIDVTAWECVPGEPVPIGVPVPNARVYVLDRALRPVPAGVPGELYLAGVQLARGYLARPDLTADRFVACPFGAPGERMYRTGDVVRWRIDAAALDYLGRSDHQVKIRGNRIELGEIEATLLAGGASEAVVVTREDVPGHPRLVAYVVPAAVDPAALREHVRATLPEYMVPATITGLDAMPLTRSGKLDRRALPAPVTADRADGFVAPRTDTERLLAGIWAEVLGIDVGRIGAHDSFFELGGDSILTIRVATAARHAGLVVAPRLMLRHETLSDLAAHVSGPAAATAVVAEQGTVSGDLPLLPVQRWFLEQDGDRDRLTQSVVLAVPGADPALLERALHALVEHHDALRLRVTFDGAQYLTEDEPARLLTVVEPAAPAGPRDAGPAGPRDAGPAGEVDPHAVADRVRDGLSLEHGPVLGAALLGGDRLFLAVHHLAVDVVSWQVLVPDLATAYHQLAAGRAVTLPAKTTSVAHWARRLAAHAVGAETAAELPYWSRREPAAPLPRDRPGAPGTYAHTATVTAALAADTTAALLHRVPAVYRTRITEVLLAALGRTVTRWSGGDRLLVDLEGHGREDLFDDVDLTRTVGWFTTVFPVSLHVPDTGAAALLASARDQVRAIPRRGVGYGLLRHLRDADTTATLAALPAPELRFNYTGRQTTAPGTGGPMVGPSFEPLHDRLGSDQGAGGTRPYLLDVDAGVRDGRLVVTWSYSTEVHDGTTVRALADGFVAELTALVEHCVAAGPLRARMNAARVPGVSVAVVSGGAVADAWTHGVTSVSDPELVTRETLFQAGSVSKLVTALVALRLAEDGVLDLDKDVDQYLLSWRPGPGPTITTRHLLAHTAGLNQVWYLGYRRDEQAPTPVDVLHGRAPYPAARRELEPGTTFRYSGTHYAVVQQLLEDLTGEPFAALARRVVLAPLGMTSSSFDPRHPETAGLPVAVGHDADGSPVDGGWRVHPELAVGSLWSTPTDLAAVLLAVQRSCHGSPDGEPGALLSPASARELLDGGEYGLGVIVDRAGGRVEFGHGGETVGYRTVLIGDLDGGGVVVMTNGDAGNQVANLVTGLLRTDGLSPDRLRTAIGTTGSTDIPGTTAGPRPGNSAVEA